MIVRFNNLSLCSSSSANGKLPTTPPVSAQEPINPGAHVPARVVVKGRVAPKPLSTEGSVIPGESEEDGLIRKEYVLVGDVRALEFNQAVDGMLQLQSQLYKGSDACYRTQFCSTTAGNGT